MTTTNDDLKKKVLIFFQKKIPVHITLQSHSWRNGTIEELEADFLLLKEFKYGLCVLFFSEIRSVEMYNDEAREVKK